MISAYQKRQPQREKSAHLYEHFLAAGLIPNEVPLKLFLKRVRTTEASSTRLDRQPKRLNLSTWFHQRQKSEWHQGMFTGKQELGTFTAKQGR